MKINCRIIKTANLPDGAKEVYLDLPASQYIYLGYLLEGLEGYCYHSICDLAGVMPHNGKQPEHKKLLKLTIPPDYFREVMNFLHSLNDEGSANE